MKSLFMAVMVGGGVVLFIVGMAWIATATEEARVATGRRALGTHPSNAKGRAAARTCELCDAGVSREQTDLRCPLIEAYVFVRAESIRLDDCGVRADGGDAEPGIDGLGQG